MNHTKTWDADVPRCLRETRHKRTHKDDKAKIDWLDWLDCHLAKTPLHDITRERVDEIMDIKERQSIKPATVNKYLALVRAALRAAVYQWAWLNNPPQLRMRKVDSHRTRFLSRQEAAHLIAQLPAHLKAMAIFSLHTGLCAGNVIRLQWSQVYLHPS